MFGYLVVVTLSKLSPDDKKIFCGFVEHEDNMENFNTLMKRLWAIEECHARNSMLRDVEIYSERHINETHLRP